MLRYNWKKILSCAFWNSMNFIHQICRVRLHMQKRGMCLISIQLNTLAAYDVVHGSDVFSACEWLAEDVL